MTFPLVRPRTERTVLRPRATMTGFMTLMNAPGRTYNPWRPSRPTGGGHQVSFMLIAYLLPPAKGEAPGDARVPDPNRPYAGGQSGSSAVFLPVESERGGRARAPSGGLGWAELRPRRPSPLPRGP